MILAVVEMWICTTQLNTHATNLHDDVIKWKHFPRNWPFVRGIHRQWRGALMFSLICVWINGWVNNREAGDFRRHRGHYDVIVMIINPMECTDCCVMLCLVMVVLSARSGFHDALTNMCVSDNATPLSWCNPEWDSGCVNPSYGYRYRLTCWNHISKRFSGLLGKY